jgi:hypothetical protein
LAAALDDLLAPIGERSRVQHGADREAQLPDASQRDALQHRCLTPVGGETPEAGREPPGRTRRRGVFPEGARSMNLLGTLDGRAELAEGRPFGVSKIGEEG